MFWIEFVKELRFQYEHGLSLPHLLSGDAPQFEYLLIVIMCMYLCLCEYYILGTSTAVGRRAAIRVHFDCDYVYDFS